MEQTIRFQVLGQLRARIDTTDVPITAVRERIVLATLLLRANDAVPVTQLIDTVWGQQPPRNARTQLQGRISRLRRQLADHGLRHQIILTDQAGYRISVAPAAVDLLEFRRLRDQARAAAAADRGTDASRHYRAALALWHGPALAGLESEPVRQAAAALDEERVQAVEECVEIELALGLAGELVGELTELAQQHPYREPLHGARMLALYRSGRQADALAAYQQVRRRLQDELGTEPGRELQRLHRAMLRRDPELDPAAVHRAGPATVARPVPRELPTGVASFTGRDRELATLDSALPDPATGGPTVIAAIAGTAGVGKTALAVHWAHRVTSHFPDGQLYLNLRGYATGPALPPIEALAALLRSLGVPPEQIPTDQHQAAATYRTQLADRRMLVVLDNARSADQVRPLLPGSPGCLVLITSRDRLSGLVARDGARRLSLDVLTTTEAHTLLTHLLGTDRVHAEPETVDRLATACAHLPLALRIAAANLADQPAMTIQAYLAQLSDPDRVTGLRAGADDQSSVPAALDLSYRALPAGTARLFRLLGLVPGPDFTAATAAALTATSLEDATADLCRLAAAHLVQEHAPGRYTFHDLLRRYARGLATGDRGEPAGTLARLLDHYLQAAGAAAARLYPEMLRLPGHPEGTAAVPAGFDRPADALAWLEAERMNLVAAVQYAAEHGPRPMAWLLADRLRGYFWHRRYNPDWLVVARAGLAAATDDGDPLAQAACRLSIADFHHCVGRFSEATEHYAAAADLADRSGWPHGQGAALANLGIVHRLLGQPHRAAECYSRALAHYRQSDRPGAHASITTNLGGVCFVLGELEQAATHHRQALALYRRLGSVPGEATALRNLGVAELALGRLDQAEAHLTRALARYREVGNRSGEVGALDGLAMFHRDAGQLDQAADLARASAALAAEIGDRPSEAVALGTLGSVQLQLGRPHEAADHYRDAVELASRARDHFHQAQLRLGLAAAHHRRKECETAEQHARQVLELARAVGYRVVAGQALTLLAEVRLDQGHPDEARQHAGAALERHRETGHRLGEARTRALLDRLRQPDQR